MHDHFFITAFFVLISLIVIFPVGKKMFEYLVLRR